MGVKAYSVNIIGLSNKEHHFNYEIKNDFFEQYGKGLVEGGNFTADVMLNKHETFIEADFKIKGEANLICDRSLDPFTYPVGVRKKIVFKYGDSDEEISDEIIMIARDKDSLDLGQYMYEFIGLEIPMKKLHPRYANEGEDENSEGKLIYSSGESSYNPESDEDIDPRWEKLKKLK
ncbi:YceD family protein [Chryseosolibacter indicus]|uniref:DUF177 domain-containing protein n=1 Tax=Chryseosolibacter indicus TaxID=2782351 RepID=A0ABS5VLU0_9BACT|nr:DUF177 domain-containing protein [Chryseosolibacter indicus]MBT1702336.1 DUF177 domain-containing protein [Chryseosolibacter indicus]